MRSPPLSLAPAVRRVLAEGGTESAHGTDQRIMDAVVAELLLAPLSKLTVEDVAARAGVTRMTVYRRFENRENLVETTMAREVSRFFREIARADDPASPPAVRITEAFATALQLTHANPLVANWLENDPGELLNMILAEDAFVLAAGSAFIATGIERELASATRDSLHPQAAGELLARLYIAIVVMPPTSVDLKDPEQARRFARDLIAPLIARPG